MFRKVLLALGLLLLCSATAFCQSTTVSGVITDAGAQTWNNGTFNFVFVPSAVNPVGPYSWTGGTLPTNIGGSLSGTGTYSVSIPSNTAISPIQTAWTATFCPQASSPCFTVSNITITGATQTLNATPPTILINLQSAQPPVLAYTNSEISGAALGSQYFNLVSGALQTCTAISGNNCTTWSSAGTATNATNLVGPGSITGSFSGTHTETGNVTLQGNNTHSGTETFTGTINCANVNGVRCISPTNPQGWAGSDLGAWINAAQTNCAGSCIIQVASGTYTLSTATSIGNAAGTVKTAVELGAVTITASAAITIYFGSSLYGPPASREGNIASYGIPAVIKQANSANLNAVIQCGDGTNNGNNCNVHDLLIDGNGTNNPSTNYLLLASKSSGFEWFRLSAQSSALHGLGVISSTNGDEACCGRIYSVISQSNTGSGLFIKDSSDLSVTGTRSEFESNGRYGLECQTCGGLSFIGNETSTNLLGGISITNDAANLTGNANIHIIANRLTNNGGHAIQMTGQAVSTTDSFIIANNIVAGTNTTSNTFDGINLLGVSTIVVSNNHILNGSAHTYRYGINVQAGTGGDNWNLVSGNDFDIAGGAFGTGLFLGTSLTSFQTNLEGTTGQAQLTGPYVANTIPYSSKNAGGTVVPLVQMDGSSNVLIGADATQKFIQIRPNGMASGSNTVNITPGGTNFGMSIAPAAAGASDLGAASIPWGNLWLGTAATNNFKFQPGATAAARTISIVDPLGNTNLVLTPAAGTIRSSLHISDQGTACANGNIVLSAGWGTTATTTAAAGQGQTCQFTLTSSGTGQAATPTITDTLPTVLPSASVVCTAQMVGGTGANTLINQTTLSATAPVFTFGGTPVAASTYFVVVRCGP